MFTKFGNQVTSLFILLQLIASAYQKTSLSRFHILKRLAILILRSVILSRNPIWYYRHDHSAKYTSMR